MKKHSITLMPDTALFFGDLIKSVYSNRRDVLLFEEPLYKWLKTITNGINKQTDGTYFYSKIIADECGRAVEYANLTLPFCGVIKEFPRCEISIDLASMHSGDYLLRSMKINQLKLAYGPNCTDYLEPKLIGVVYEKDIEVIKAS